MQQVNIQRIFRGDRDANDIYSGPMEYTPLIPTLYEGYSRGIFVENLKKNISAAAQNESGQVQEIEQNVASIQDGDDGTNDRRNL